MCFLSFERLVVIGIHVSPSGVEDKVLPEIGRAFDFAQADTVISVLFTSQIVDNHNDA